MKIYSPTNPAKESSYYRIKINAKFRDLSGEPNLVSCFKNGRIKWLDHVNHMTEKRFPKQIMEGCPHGERGRGRPRLQWMDNVKVDLRSLGVRPWRGTAEDRSKWRRIVEEAKAPHRP